jgi:hypothetical protein
MLMRRRNLIILHDTRVQPDRDFREIAKRVNGRKGDIRAYVITERRRNLRAQLAQLLHPTLFVQMEPVAGLWRLRGYLAAPKSQGKMADYRMLEAAGLPVPRWTEIVPGIALDPAEWGPWVVVKADRGLRGLDVEAVATRELRYRKPEELPQGHLGRTRGPLLAQRFVRTGPAPVYYRVLTCFGVPLCAIHYTDRNPVEPGTGVTSPPIVVVRKPHDHSQMTDNPEVIALARRVHALIPDVPALGCDILRSADDGSLWLAEINRSSVWALSSEIGIRRQASWGNDYYGQFGALDRAAEAMVEATRRFAR